MKLLDDYDLIDGFKEGDDITIMNSVYRSPKPVQTPTGQKWDNGLMTIMFKDNKTGKKYHQDIPDPLYEYFVAKEGKETNYPRLIIDEKDVNSVTVPYRNLERDIAKRTGYMNFYNDNISSGNKFENKKLHMMPNLFLSDMHIEDYYRLWFSQHYQNNTTPITKSYLDIEADTVNMAGDFPEPGECPINAVSVVFQSQRKIYTFLLRTKGNEQIAEFEKEVKAGTIFPELREFIVQALGGPARAKYYGNIDQFGFNFLFYDEDKEIDLIADIFSLINKIQPDFLLAWNMSFDIPYIIARIKKLGYEPENIMCSPDFQDKRVNYFIDERSKNEYAERGDYATISSYTIYLDQMIHFASRRKGQSEFTSFSLDFIGEVIADVKKLDYKHITTKLQELPYKSFKTFVFYNIMDTIVQYCIEARTQDLEYVYSKCLINNTRYSKCHRQTIYLTNRGTKEFNSDGFIIGNNCNRANSKPAVKFPGAFVADPRQINDYSRVKINGHPTNLFNNLDDFDYSSLYPSVIREFNIACFTQIGMLIIDKEIHDKENKRNDDKWTRGGAFMEDFQSHVWLEFCTRWLNLANYTELYEDVEEFFTNVMCPHYSLRQTTTNGLTVPIVWNDRQLPMCEDNKDDLIQPMTFFVMPDLNKFMEWRTNAISKPNQSFRQSNDFESVYDQAKHY